MRLRAVDLIGPGASGVSTNSRGVERGGQAGVAVMGRC